MALILTVNAGSATVKLDIFESNGDVLDRKQHKTLATNDGDPAGFLSAFVMSAGEARPTLVVHRIVHGGAALTGPAVIDTAVKDAITKAVPLAPLHNPPALDWLDAASSVLPDAIQIAVPDTGFFATLPSHASQYALPRSMSERLGLRRYGFHGIAHQAMLGAWQHGAEPVCKSRVITLQLGSGCSIAAIRDGHPIDASMGFTPMEGLVMATRSGDVDPGILLYLMREERMSADEIDRLLNHESGLLGLGGSADMREVLAAGTADAEEAIAIFCYRARKYVGAYLVALGGADAILFGGGIGENNPDIRRRILEGLENFGIAIDEEANARRFLGPVMRFDGGRAHTQLQVVAVDEAAEMIRMVPPVVTSR